MAERTHTFFRGGPNHEMSVAIVYEDTTGEVLRLIVTNDHPTYTLAAGIVGTGSGKAGRRREGSWGPNTGTVVIEIPAAQRPTFDLVPDGGDPGRDDYYPTLADHYAWAEVT